MFTFTMKIFLYLYQKKTSFIAMTLAEKTFAISLIYIFCFFGFYLLFFRRICRNTNYPLVIPVFESPPTPPSNYDCFDHQAESKLSNNLLKDHILGSIL